MKPRHSFTADVLAYFKARPGVWINAGELQNVGGQFAWRTRVSDARQLLEAAGEGTIDSRRRRPTRNTIGRPCGPIISEYRYLPAVHVEPSDAKPHDLNAVVPGDGRLW